LKRRKVDFKFIRKLASCSAAYYVCFSKKQIYIKKTSLWFISPLTVKKTDVVSTDDFTILDKLFLLDILS